MISQVMDESELSNEDTPQLDEVVGQSSGHADWEDLVEVEGKDDHEMESVRRSLISIDVIVGEEIKTRISVDSGATYSCISQEMYETLVTRKQILGELPVSRLKLRGAVGKKWIDVRRQVLIEMTWEGQKYHVVVLVINGLFSQAILGLDWLRENKMMIDCE